MKFIYLFIAITFLMSVMIVSADDHHSEDKYISRRRNVDDNGPPNTDPIPDLSSRLLKKRSAAGTVWNMMSGTPEEKVDVFFDIVDQLEANANGQCFPNDMVPADYAKLICVLFGAVEAGLLHDNGPFVTRNGTWSELDTSVFNIYGWGWQSLYGNRLADDFTVPPNYTWFVRGGATFGYQTGSTTNSTYTAVNYRLWDGHPGNSSTSSILSGNTTLNYLTDSKWTGIYRTIIHTQATNRPIMRNDMDLELTELPEGSYWFDVQATGTPSLSGPWMPPITILNMTTTGNAIQYTGSWANVTDNGYQQGIPFEIHGDQLPSRCVYYGPDGDAVLSFWDVYDIIQSYFADKDVTQSEYDGFIDMFLQIVADLGAPQEVMDAVEDKLHDLDGAVVTGGAGEECASAANHIHSWLEYIH